MMTTQAEAQNQIVEALHDWRTVGQVARRLGIPRSSVERQVSRMLELGELETRVERFWRNGDYRVGHVYRLVRIECAPVLEDGDRRTELLASIFECVHGVEMCDPCAARGRRCEHRCIECGPQMVFSGASSYRGLLVTCHRISLLRVRRPVRGMSR